MLDRTPPHDDEAERALLGSLLLADLDLNVSPTDFTKPSYQRIAKTVLDIRADGGAVDVITVADRLDLEGVLDACGGKPGLLDIQGAVPTAANAAHYHEIVTRLAKFRRRIAAAVTITADAYDLVDDDPMAVLEAAESESTTIRTLGELSDERNETLTSSRDFLGLRDFPGVHLHRGDLVIIAARPGVGKSAFAGQLTDEFGERQKKTRLYSLEMPASDWYDRLIMRHTMFTTTDLDRGLTPDQAAMAKAATAQARTWPVEINDDATMNVGRLVADMRRFSRRGGVVSITDYLGLLVERERGDSFYIAVTEASKRLKIAARQTSLVNIVLAQLSRKTISDSGAMRPPVLSDLRDSGAIEQDADDIILLHTYADDDERIREHLQKKGYIMEFDKKYGGTCAIASVHFAKMRRGPEQMFPCWWDAKDQRFFPMDRV